MLLEFRVRNHRSLKEEQALSFEPSKASNAYLGGQLEALPALALYGANASGKSNVLAALMFMRHAVRESHRRWNPEGGIPRDPFAWNQNRQETSLYELTFSVDSVRYQYGFVADDNNFLEEWLFAWPKGRKQVWFERDGSSLSFGDHLKGENRTIEKFTRKNALFLSTAVQHGHEQLLPIYRWFSRVISVNVLGNSRSGPLPRSLRDTLADASGWRVRSLFEEKDGGELGKWLRDLLSAADIGITDFKVEPQRAGWETWISSRYPQVLFKHGNSSDDAWLPLEEESNGTRTLIRLAQPFFDVLKSGGVLVVDELEAGLHSLLAAYIVKQFNDSGINPHHGQLLFTTHDTNLLSSSPGGGLLGRDQVWLTEKNQEGASCLYPLSDYKPRKEENLERGYLQGRYGAIPFFGDLQRDRD